jgi:hypothetical protein
MKQSQGSGTPHAGDSFRSSTGLPYVLFSDLKYNIYMYMFVCTVSFCQEAESVVSKYGLIV